MVVYLSLLFRCFVALLHARGCLRCSQIGMRCDVNVMIAVPAQPPGADAASK